MSVHTCDPVDVYCEWECDPPVVLAQMNGSAVWSSIMRHLHGNPNHLPMMKMSSVTAHQAKWAFSVPSHPKKSNWAAIVCEIREGSERAEWSKQTYISTKRKKCVYVKHLLDIKHLLFVLYNQNKLSVSFCSLIRKTWHSLILTYLLSMNKADQQVSDKWLIS